MPRPLQSFMVNLRGTDSGAHRQTVVATDTIRPAPVVYLTAAAPITLTSTPTIADGFDGQQCILMNIGANAITIQDQGTLPASNLRLTAATLTMATRQNVTLMYSATVGDWVQIVGLQLVI
jgi:hypothetical protein